MFTYDSGTGNCRFSPHQPLKHMDLYNVVEKTTAEETALYILQCSAGLENALPNSDFFTHDYGGQLNRYHT